MTHQEATAIIEHHQQKSIRLTTERLETNYGDRVKREERDQQALIFAKALMSVGGTFEFTDAHKQIGYSTVFEAMAADLHEQGANVKTRVKNGEDYEHVYRRGCAALNAKLMEDWNSAVIYTLPRTVNDKQIQVITIDGNMVINSAGETASQVHAMREEKRASGQMSASAKKLTRSVGQEKALSTLSGIVASISNMVQLPQGKREEEMKLPDFLTE
jgi:hypothetical protein